ncbi:MAG: DUF2788 domain-containing protein [Pseudomonadales bacterium]|jgi:hypothetical protein
MITDKMLTEYAMPVMLAALIMYMIFIVYKLGKDSNAGKIGGIVLSVALLVGVAGFVIKFFIKIALDTSIS